MGARPVSGTDWFRRAVALAASQHIRETLHALCPTPALSLARLPRPPPVAGAPAIPILTRLWEMPDSYACVRMKKREGGMGRAREEKAERWRGTHGKRGRRRPWASPSLWQIQRKMSGMPAFSPPTPLPTDLDERAAIPVPISNIVRCRQCVSACIRARLRLHFRSCGSLSHSFSMFHAGTEKSLQDSGLRHILQHVLAISKTHTITLRETAHKPKLHCLID